MNWNKFINFETLIMPSVIKILYILSSVAVIGYSIFIMFGPLSNRTETNVGMGVIFLVVALLVIRLYSELLIILFKISANVSKIAANNNK